MWRNLRTNIKKNNKEDNFFNKTNFENLLGEIIASFQETTSKELVLNLDNDKNKFNIQRTPEIMYGLRNFIGNAIKFTNYCGNMHNK